MDSPRILLLRARLAQSPLGDQWCQAPSLPSGSEYSHLLMRERDNEPGNREVRQVREQGCCRCHGVGGALSAHLLTAPFLYLENKSQVRQVCLPQTPLFCIIFAPQWWLLPVSLRSLVGPCHYWMENGKLFGGQKNRQSSDKKIEDSCRGEFFEKSDLVFLHSNEL